MNSKKYSVFITALFSIFIGGLFIAFLLSPKREFSDTENRVLAGAPELSWETVADGSYMEELETYIADQFPLRDMWIVIKSSCEYALGKREFNDVYLSGDTLISKVEKPDQNLVDRNLGYLEGFVQSVGKPVYLAIIPTAAEIWKDKLPEGAPSFDQQAFLQQLQQNTSANWVDVLSALQQHTVQAEPHRATLLSLRTLTLEQALQISQLSAVTTLAATRPAQVQKQQVRTTPPAMMCNLAFFAIL